MSVVYVAGKYSSGNVDDRDYYVSIADERAKELLENGHIPIVPHRISYAWEEDDRFSNYTSDDWLDKFCIPLLNICDALLVTCGEEDSYGVQKEIQYAKAMNIPVYYSVEDVR